MMLNESSKAQNELEQQECDYLGATKGKIEALTAGLAEGSDQLEASKPAPQGGQQS